MPIVAALCGMVVPAGVFIAINLALPGGHPDGWAIPMATDIAFALAILGLVGRSYPPACGLSSSPWPSSTTSGRSP